MAFVEVRVRSYSIFGHRGKVGWGAERRCHLTAMAPTGQLAVRRILPDSKRLSQMSCEQPTTAVYLGFGREDLRPFHPTAWFRFLDV